MHLFQYYEERRNASHLTEEEKGQVKEHTHKERWEREKHSPPTKLSPAFVTLHTRERERERDAR